jgi:hypothetical protein
VVGGGARINEGVQKKTKQVLTFTCSFACLRMIASPSAADTSEVALAGESESTSISVSPGLGVAAAGAGAVAVSPVVPPSDSLSQSCI